MNNILVKTSGKRILYYYGKRGLCVKDLTKQNSNPKLIFSASVGDFDVIEMTNGEIGIICQDNEGSIVFLRENNDGYLKSTLLKNKNKAVYNKYFTLHRHGDWISVIYIIDYEGKKILSHQLVDREETTPDAVDTVSECNYCSFTDNAGNIVLLYNKERDICYKIFRWSLKQWTESEILCKGLLRCAQNNGREGIYIVFSDDGSDFCAVVENDNLKLSIKKKRNIGKSSENSIIFFEDEHFWIVKEDREKLEGTKYNSELKEINGPLFFGNDVYKKIYRIKTNEKKYLISECYGYETNNIPKLILYKNLYNTTDIHVPKQVTAEGEELLDFAGIPARKESREQIELNKMKLKISDLQKRLSKLENIVNNQLIL